MASHKWAHIFYGPLMLMYYFTHAHVLLGNFGHSVLEFMQIVSKIIFELP